ncbi:hypothetical protein PMAC_002225 [Pneumocystis sp. 'macacae']|nr:hypothetical protein PMAC_002225 [Pneumocystis sp. 'macacae']
MSTFGVLFRVSTYGESHGCSVGCIVDGVPPGLALSVGDIQEQLRRRRPGQSRLATQPQAAGTRIYSGLVLASLLEFVQFCTNLLSFWALDSFVALHGLACDDCDDRSEQDLVEIESGVEGGITLGTPIALRIRNEDVRKYEYMAACRYPRPGHADLVYLCKYGCHASSGGGRSSARETAARVAAGAIADKYLREVCGIEIVAFVSSIGRVHMEPRAVQRQVWREQQRLERQGQLDVQLKTERIMHLGESAEDKNVYKDVLKNVQDNLEKEKDLSDEDESEEDEVVRAEFLSFLAGVTREQVDGSLVRCPDAVASAKMVKRVERARQSGDSVGGTITCVVRNLPVGLGEPCFDKLEAKLAHAMLSIPSTRGFEIGSGFKGAEVSGSKHNDMYVLGQRVQQQGATVVPPRTALRTVTNNSGGILGGISNGEHLFFKVAFKPPASIRKPQVTAMYDGVEGVLEIQGRHDPNVVPRAVPIVESMTALVIMDALMIQLSRQTARGFLPLIDARIL